MKGSNDLFLLINSLTKQEKRYFKLFATRHVINDDNNFITLFDYLDKLKEYDEQEVKDHFKKASFIKSFNTTKFFLHQLILKSLHAFHARSSTEAEIHEMLHYVEILYNKKLHKQCSKVLQRIKKMAALNGKQLLLLEAIGWEISLFNNTIDIKKHKDYIDKGIKEELDALAKFSNLIQYRQLVLRLFYHIKYGSFHDKNTKELIEEIIQNPLLKDEHQALSPAAKKFYYTIYDFYYLHTDQPEKSYETIQKHLEFLEQYEAKGGMINYISLTTNFITVCLQLRRFKEAEKRINTLRSIKSKDRAIQVMLFERITFLVERLYIQQGKFEKIIEQLPDTMKELELMEKHITDEHKMIMYYSISYGYFGVGDYENALEWINRIVNYKESELRKDLYISARLYTLVIHYELNNELLMEHLVKSTTRYLKSAKSIGPFEKIFLDGMKKTSTLFDSNKSQKLFRQMFDELSELKLDATKTNEEGFDFMAWLKSKFEDRPLAEVIKEQGVNRTVKSLEVVKV